MDAKETDADIHPPPQITQIAADQERAGADHWFTLMTLIGKKIRVIAVIW